MALYAPSSISGGLYSDMLYAVALKHYAAGG